MAHGSPRPPGAGCPCHPTPAAPRVPGPCTLLAYVPGTARRRQPSPHSRGRALTASESRGTGALNVPGGVVHPSPSARTTPQQHPPMSGLVGPG